MPFCENCGTNYRTGAKFCENCGAPLPGAAVRPQELSEQQRNLEFDVKQEEQLTEGLITYFGQKARQYAEYDNATERVLRSLRGKKHALLVWGIILTSIGVLYSAINLLELVKKNALNYHFSLTGLISVLCVLVLPGIGMIIGYCAYASAFNKRRTAAVQACDVLVVELWQHYAAFGDCPVGFEYTNPGNLNAILQAIKLGRSNSIRSAVTFLANSACINNSWMVDVQNAQAERAKVLGAGGAPFHGGFFN